MKPSKNIAIATLFGLGFFLTKTHAASAQIIPDTSLGNEASIVTPSQNGSKILGGATRGENLYHSFESFNVGEGLEAYFDGPQDISHIFSRVTGSSASEIFGTLGVEGTADLFFLNENGILFGADSAIDLNGSLVLSTAQTIEFPDGRFSSNLNLDSVLSEDMPQILVVNGPSTISVENVGRTPVDATVLPSELVNKPIDNGPLPGLSSASETSLAFVAKEILFDGAIIRNGDGLISIIGLQGNVQIEDDPLGWVFTVDSLGDVSESGTVEIMGNSLVESVGTISGQVNLVGNEISVVDGSSVIVANYGGSTYQGGVFVTAGNLVIGDFYSANANSPSDIFAQSINGERGGEISIEANNLQLVGGGQIIVTATDTASGGDITVDVEEGISIDGIFLPRPGINSSIVNTTYGSGRSGGVEIISTDLKVTDGGNIVTSTVGSGRASDVFVNSDRIVVSGVLPFVTRPSYIGSVTAGTGNSGNLFLGTETLEILEGAGVGTANLGFSGDAQDAVIVATDSILVSGISPSKTTPTGIERSALRSSSSITDPVFAFVLDSSGALLGNAGNLSVETPQLTIRDGGIVSVQNDGTGDGGIVRIEADSIEVLDAAAILASTAGGQGGDVEIISRSLVVATDASLEATALEEGDGGNLAVDSIGIALVENATISANAEGGRGGTVTLSAGAFFDDGSGSITATSARGPQFNGIVTIDSPDPSLEETSTIPTEAISYPELTLACNTSTASGDFSLILTGTGGTPISIGSLHRSFEGWSPTDRSSTANISTGSTDSKAQGWVANSDGTYRMVSQREEASQIVLGSVPRNCTS